MKHENFIGEGYFDFLIHRDFNRVLGDLSSGHLVDLVKPKSSGSCHSGIGNARSASEMIPRLCGP